MPRRRRVAIGIVLTVAAALGDAWAATIAQLAARQRRLRLRAVERAAEAHRAREAAEVALDQVKAGSARASAVGRLLARDDQHAAALNRMRTASRGDAGHVQHDLDGFVGLEDIERRVAFARVRPAARRPRRRGEVGEELTEVVGQLAGIQSVGRRRTRAIGGRSIARASAHRATQVRRVVRMRRKDS